MKFLIHLIAESEVGQHVQEIACLERKELLHYDGMSDTGFVFGAMVYEYSELK